MYSQAAFVLIMQVFLEEIMLLPGKHLNTSLAICLGATLKASGAQGLTGQKSSSLIFKTGEGLQILLKTVEPGISCQFEFNS